jgi:serine/threonine protein kinase
MEGFLRKKGILGWSTRFFQLKGNKLLYSHDESSSSTKVLQLTGLTVYPSNKQFSLALVGADGKTALTLQADNVQDFARWERALQAGTGTEAGAEIHNDEEGPSPEDYTKLYVIGKGSFGKVLKVKSNKNGQIYAMKVMYKDMVVEKRLINVVMSETTLLRRLHYPFIIELHESFQNSSELFFILDYHSGGSLQMHIERWGGVGEEMGRFYAGEICLALMYLHGQGVMHRDLKLSNILLDRHGHAILTDFGTAKQQITARTFCGTPLCMAPEVINHQAYTQAVDWWSYGVILFQMVHGKDPYHGPTREALYHSVLNNPVSFPNPRISENCKNLITGLMKKDARQRFSSPQVQGSPWFATMDWQALENKRVPPPWVPDREYVCKAKDKTGSVHKAPTGPAADSFEGFTYSKTASTASNASPESPVY